MKETISIKNCNHSTADYPHTKLIRMIRGDTYTFSVRMIMDGAPYMLPEGGRASFVVFDKDSVPVFSRIYDRSDQDENGFFTVTMLPGDTGLLPDACKYEVEYHINSDTVYTVLSGDICAARDLITPAVRACHDE